MACAPAADGFEAEAMDGSDAGADEDDFSDLGDKALTATYQAENRTGQNGVVAASNYEGYTGTAFMDYGGNGTWLEWSNVNTSDAGEYTFSARYANGSSSNRQAAIIVNGKSVGELAFAPTGAWDTWKTATIKATLRGGSNSVRIQANTSSGGPNLDRLTTSGGSSGGTGTVRDLDLANFSKLSKVVTTFNNVNAKYVVYAESHGRDGHNDIRSDQPGFVGMSGATLVGYGGGRDKYLAIFRVNSSTVIVDTDQGQSDDDGGAAQVLFIKTTKTLSVVEARSVDPSLKSEQVPGPRNNNEIVIYADDEGGKGERDEFFMPKAYKYYGSGDDLLYVFAQGLSGGPNGNGAFMRLSIR